jgi:DNA-binding transcriptional LysR family regulator
MVIGIPDHRPKDWLAMSRISAPGLTQLRVRHLKLLEALVAVGSLHKAATNLHLSQPAASAMLKEVEHALGTPLFERTRRGVVPNAHGGVAVARARTILGELAMLAQELKAARPTQILRFGTVNHALYGVLQRVLPEFLARTSCRIDLYESSLKHLRMLLETDELDCMLGRLPTGSIDPLLKRGVFYQPLYDFDLCVLAAPSHPLAKRRKVTLADASKFSWILQREGTNSRYTLFSSFAAAGLPEPNIRMETTSFVVSLQLLSVSDWLTVVPRDAGINQQRLGLARVLPVKLSKLLAPVAFIAPRSAMANPNVSLLWEVIRGAKLG